MEKYLDWIIDEHDVTRWFLQDGMVKLQAEISPNLEVLYDFIYENKLVSTPFYMIKNTIEACIMEPVYMHNIYLNKIPHKDMEICNAVAEFCSSHKYTVTKTGHAILSIGQTGGEQTRKRAMNKIKKWIAESLPNPREKLIDYLKSKKMIPQDARIFCEIRTKDL